MSFFSGTKDLIGIGLEEVKPMIDFMDAKLLPTASTRALTITFPRCFGELQYEQFKSKMDLCILGSQGFGNI